METTEFLLYITSGLVITGIPYILYLLITIDKIHEHYESEIRFQKEHVKIEQTYTKDVSRGYKMEIENLEKIIKTQENIIASDNRQIQNLEKVIELQKKQLISVKLEKL